MSNMTGLGSSCSSRSCCGQHVLPAAAAPSAVVAGATAAAAAARRRSPQCVAAHLHHHQLQQQSILSVPRQQPAQVVPQQQLPNRPQQLLSCQLSRSSVVAAAGRRRRQDVGVEEGDPDLDVDDVMYAGDGDADDTSDILAVDDTVDFEEFEEAEEGESDEEDEELEEDEEAPQGDEDWAAALDEFDTALDAQPVEQQGPSKEEQELAAAKAMVRFDEEGADYDGTTLIISEIPPEEPDRPKTFDEKTEALSPQDKQTLEQNIASYTVFPMDELELLVSSTVDGQLVLSDCFCLDTQEDIFFRPNFGEQIPSHPGLYQVIPWELTKSGNYLKNKDPQVQRIKLYFVGLHSAEPHEVDMTRVYSFDSDTRELVSHTPKVLGADDLSSILDPVMRIREDGVWIEEAEVLPGTYFIAEGYAGHPMERYDNPDRVFDMHDFVKAPVALWDKPRSMEELLALQAGSTTTADVVAAEAAAAEDVVRAMDTLEENQLEERLEELELMEELDDMPDVPAVDMM